MASYESTQIDFVLNQLRSVKDIPAELSAIFREEADDHLHQIYESLSRLGQSSNDQEIVATIRRSAHTLKGAAGAVGMEAVTRLSHRMEDLLDQMADVTEPVSDNRRQLLLQTTDLLQDLVAGEIIENESLPYRIQNVYQQFDSEIGAVTENAENLFDPTSSAIPPVASNEATESEADSPTELAARAPITESQFIRVPLQRLDELVGTVGEMIVNRSAMSQRLSEVHARVASTFSILERMQLTSFELQSNHNLELFQPHVADTNTGFEGNSMSGLSGGVSDRDSDFQLLAQMLSEGCNDIELISREMRNLKTEIEGLLRRQDRFNREAQTALSRIRMVPISSIVSKLQRTTRTVSGKLKKSIELVVKGDHTELDKTVVDQMIAPLQHLIRNAIDHGIESPGDREAIGKPKHSQLVLEALYQGTQVTLRLSDDGRGINFDRLRAKAIEFGKLLPGEAQTHDEKCRLLFLPGITTAKNLTDVSGRGVGMDIVREAVERLNGNIRVQSEMGKGTTFTIQLPISVGVTQVLMVEAANHKFAIPMQAIDKITRLNISSIHESGNKTTVQIDGETMELRDLANHLELPTRRYINPTEAPLTVVLQGGADRSAVIVESISGSEEVVVKSLGSHLQQIPGLLGATIEGDGTVVPILDPMDIVGRASDLGFAEGLAHESKRCQEPQQVFMAMVIDDSLSIRRATENLLQSAGWNVVLAKDGLDAIEKLDELETQPSIFLCDMEMPRMDGIELVRRLRKNPEFKKTPFVMITSRSAETHSAMALEAGVSHYLVKPYNDDDLLDLINELVQIAHETIEA